MRALLRQAVLAYGGVDDIIVTAGIYVPPDRDGRMPDERWATTFAVNVTGGLSGGRRSGRGLAVRRA